MNYIAYILFGYFSGSIMYSRIIPKMTKGIDITETPEDKNPGAANAIAQAGIPIGLLCLVLDLLKGSLPVFMCAASQGMNDIMFSIVMLAPVIGHAIAIPHINKYGGKAIAVSFGVLIGLLPYSPAVFALIVPYLAFSLVFKIGSHSKRTIAAFTAAAINVLFIVKQSSVIIGTALISATVVYKHLEIAHRIKGNGDVENVAIEESK